MNLTDKASTPPTHGPLGDQLSVILIWTILREKLLNCPIGLLRIPGLDGIDIWNLNPVWIDRKNRAMRAAIVDFAGGRIII